MFIKMSILRFAIVFAIYGSVICDSSDAGDLHRCSADAAGMESLHLQQIDDLVEQAIEEGKLPGCVVVVGRTGQVAFAKAYGNRQILPTIEAMTLDTVFDMASLTKPIATATSVMLLLERGQIRLRDPVSNYIPEFALNGKEDITIEQLLTHQGGLIPDNPLADYKDGEQLAWERIFQLKPEVEPGTKFIYTDVGFLVLAELVRRVTGQDIHEFSQANVFAPLGMHETGYCPPEHLAFRSAPSEQRDGMWLKGQVHDPRAALLAGVAGHAGLFSTVADLVKYANMMLAGGSANGRQVLSAATASEMTRPRDVAGNRRGLGWDMRSVYSRNRGELFSPRAFGHGGFTGTAMWIDPGLDLYVIFLSNRLHPDGDGSVNDLAGRIGTIAAAAIRESCKVHAECSQDPVLTGIDVLERDQFTQLAGSNVGLITNHTGVNRRGIRTANILKEAEDFSLVALFSPEHGIAGLLDVSDIGDSRDESTNIPIYSLYGENRRPMPEQLEGIDTLVFDIQDIGCRFYTYISTMVMAMEVAAEYGLRFVVLDRPNPIDGVTVSGPIRDPGQESFVAIHSLPIRHGMTVGELASLMKAERGLDLNLLVIPCEGWHRQQRWDSTGLTWINPSPNMRRLTQAMLYPGIGLLETTNISVGRGTDTPFEVLGAPWIDRQELAGHLNDLELAGLRFVPIVFTPSSSKHAQITCDGVSILVTDLDSVSAVDAGLQIALTLRRLYPQQWDVSRFNRLLANQSVYDAVLENAPMAHIQGLTTPGLNQFRARRPQYLLYE